MDLDRLMCACEALQGSVVKKQQKVAPILTAYNNCCD